MSRPLVIRTTTLERLATCPFQVHLSEEYPSLDLPSDGQERGRIFHQYVRSIAASSDREQAYKQAIIELSRVRPDALPGLASVWEKLLSNSKLEVIALEETFEKPLVIDGMPVTFQGTIDAVFRLDDEVFICDYKLLKHPRYFQPTLQRFTYVLFSPYKEVITSFWFVLVGLDGSFDPIIYDAQAIKSDPEYEEHLIGLIRHYTGLKTHLYKRPGKHCSWCPFQSICKPNKDLAAGKMVTLIGSYVAKDSAL